MEIIRRQDKLPSLLDQARRELEAFHSRVPSVRQQSSDASGMRKSEQKHGERILYCSQVQQGSSVLILKIVPDGAEITEVIKRHPAPVTRSAKTTKENQDSDVRELLWGNYKGCPHCGHGALVMCSRCGSLSCLGDSASTMTCPVCAHSGQVKESGISLEFARSKPAVRSVAQSLLPRGTVTQALPWKK
ncbi:hypothetical protein NPS53_11780 [Pseudomonas putida]|uniref:TerY-C metal binding domain-containing protein n=1 Tax=Pseudomonas putida TaxID=303 RepID=UPI00236439F9|nr:TerY-C metal binding domain-containing protein [Pseudomonas putida]MDD2140258.1 hypothetical protein [Pseudomonas putida]HDS1725604.1 hypothetical protein [Pseudomonas putida]